MPIKPPFRRQDAPRRAQPLSARAGGWMQQIKDQYAALVDEVQGLKLRLEPADLVCEPAAAIGTRTFTPELQAFALDTTMLNGATSLCNYVLRDGVTYSIPIIFPPPGLFEARFLHVRVTQRCFNPNEGGAFNVHMPVGQALSQRSTVNATTGGLQTLKWSVIPNRFINFFWNIVDGKSGRQLSDEMLPDMLLLPALAGAFVSTAAPIAMQPSESGDVGLELDAPWLFERDADVAFLFRPVTPVIQPAPSVASPFSWNDLEVNDTVRNASVTVHVEMHGSRLLSDVDAQRSGARVDAERLRGGFG